VLVALSVGGRYLRLGAHGDRRVRGDGTVLDAAAVFDRVGLGHGRVALETLAGDYLTMRPDDRHGFGLYPDRTLTPAAAFEEVLWPSGHVSLRSIELTYVAVEEPGLAVTVNRVEAPLGARLSYVRPPGVVPRQRTTYARPRATVPAAGDAGRGPCG
jgi:hypothetical protein